MIHSTECCSSQLLLRPVPERKKNQTRKLPQEQIYLRLIFYININVFSCLTNQCKWPFFGSTKVRGLVVKSHAIHMLLFFCFTKKEKSCNMILWIKRLLQLQAHFATGLSLDSHLPLAFEVYQISLSHTIFLPCYSQSSEVVPLDHFVTLQETPFLFQSTCLLSPVQDSLLFLKNLKPCQLQLCLFRQFNHCI